MSADNTQGPGPTTIGAQPANIVPPGPIYIEAQQKPIHRGTNNDIRVSPAFAKQAIGDPIDGGPIEFSEPTDGGPIQFAELTGETALRVNDDEKAYIRADKGKEGWGRISRDDNYAIGKPTHATIKPDYD